MTQPSPDPAVERFHATNGRFSGYVGLGCAVLVLALAINSWHAEYAPAAAVAAVLGALLVWAALLRPAVWISGDDLVLRSMFHTDHVPLAAITQVAVGQVLAVVANGRRYTSPVIGYSVRQTVKARRARGDQPVPTASDTYQVFVQERIEHLAAERRELGGGAADRAARRTFAWPEIAAGAGLVVVLVVAVLV
ncbi:hypothetical protein [Nocardioides sp.]|uniref:hypothetical protein n=1 Tax=Nocardioides sp. TaxID=35761 RepID=UPI002ED94D9A